MQSGAARYLKEVDAVKAPARFWQEVYDDEFADQDTEPPSLRPTHLPVGPAVNLNFLLHCPQFRRIIARLFVMGGTSAQLTIGWQASLLGRQTPATPAVKLHSRNSRRPQPTTTVP